jgi:starch synthase
VLGAGDRNFEQAFVEAAERHRGRIGTVIGYNDGLSHLLLGGTDAILVPSRFEPCGLTQLQGLRYGCVPVVSRVGGLADTVIDANDAAVTAGAGNGIQFALTNETSLDNALLRSNRLFATRDAWRRLQLNGMGCDVSWKRSARRYAALFRSLVLAAPGVSEAKEQP